MRRAAVLVVLPLGCPGTAPAPPPWANVPADQASSPARSRATPIPPLHASNRAPKPAPWQKLALLSDGICADG